ncbi:MAG: hypothetical protein KBD50_01340 [Candidatus Pacebacteria bacterium]|nr:hypothetical protein [Candidatus Paceibacterota bacterium]
MKRSREEAAKWWASLSKNEKEDAVRPYKHLTDKEVQAILGLSTPNQVATVKHRLRLQQPGYTPKKRTRIGQEPLTQDEQLRRADAPSPPIAKVSARKQESPFGAAFPEPNEDITADELRFLSRMYTEH